MNNTSWNPATAERAIEAFERIHGLSVTVQGLAGDAVLFFRPDRFRHRAPLCHAVKALGHSDLTAVAEGHIHVCHGGLVKWIVPVFRHDRPCLILFAGQRLPERGPVTGAPASATSAVPCSWAKVAALPSEARRREALLIMEHLQQLGARLKFWLEDGEPVQARRPEPAPGFAAGAPSTRRMIVSRFIDEHYAQPVTLAMLARKLCLSESRTSHIVRQCCHSSFRELLLQKRLRVAMELLRESGLTVLEVATASGFENAAHFHRLFRWRMGTTPAQYRAGRRS